MKTVHRKQFSIFICAFSVVFSFALKFHLYILVLGLWFRRKIVIIYLLSLERFVLIDGRECKRTNKTRTQFRNGGAYVKIKNVAIWLLIDTKIFSTRILQSSNKRFFGEIQNPLGWRPCTGHFPPYQCRITQKTKQAIAYGPLFFQGPRDNGTKYQKLQVNK